MKKKFLALVLTLAMVLSLVPVTALAAGATPTLDVVDGYYNNDNQWVQGEQARSDELQNTVTTVDKTAEKVDGQDNQYDVTLTVQMKHKETAVPPGAAATVLVIDTSGSMNDKTQCNKEEHVHDSTCYTWEECTQKNHPRHYWWDYWEKEYKHVWPTSCTWDGNKYIYRHLTCNKEEHQHNNCGSTTRIEAAKVAAKNFLNSYRGGTVSGDKWTPSTTSLQRYVSVVWFNEGVSSSEWLDVSTQTEYQTAIASIDALSANEGTNLDAGLRMANAQLKNNTVKGMSANVVVLTDGEPTYYLEEVGNRPDITIDGTKYKIKNNGKSCTQNTYNQTVSTAQTLKNSASVYTVCFGASSEILSQVNGEPTVGTFLQEKVATQPEAGSAQRYAYDANDTTDLYKAFAAISSSVVSGLNTGTVEDALPAGVSCTQDGIFDDSRTLTWQLDPETATKSKPDSNDFITYTYEKKYTVKIDPAAEGLNVVDGYVPLNLPTKLTVKNSDNRDVDIPFPIPAGKVTYSLTSFNKELVTVENRDSTLNIPEGVTIPETATSSVEIGDSAITLLYKITVLGNRGAKFVVTDSNATLVAPQDNSITVDATNSTFSGTVGTTGETVFYVSKQFTEHDIDSDTQTVSNTATIAPGDNAKGPDNKEKTVTTTVTEPEPTTADITVNFYKDSVSEKNKVNQTPFVMKNQTIGDEITLGDPVIDMFKPEGYNSGVQQGTVPYVVVAGTNVINVLYTKKEVNPPVTLDVSRSKIASGLTKNSNGDWTTTVTLTLPTVKQAETTVTTDTVNGTEVTPIIAISTGSYVIDKIGNEFTFVPELTLKVGGETYTGVKDESANTYTFATKDGKTYPDTVTYIAKNGDTPAQFTWNINKDVYTGTKVTLSYKLKLTNPNTAAGTYGVTDLDGNGFVDGAETTKVVAANALYTNESATLYKDKQEIAVFPMPSVSYTIKDSSGGHGGNGGGTVTIPDDVPTGLNGKDHYAYVVGYPDGMVYPQKNITRAEVATIFFRLLEDETREANMTKSNSYNDMKDGAWYTCAVSTLSKMGIIKGYEDGSFKPDASISRAEFAAIAARFDPDGDKTPATFSDVSSHWAKDEISIAANHGWIKGYEDGSFKPDQKITRAETMTLVNRVLKRLPETKDDLHKDMKTWPDNQNESAWFYLAVQEATNSHYQKLKKDGTHETWESMRETRDWAALEK